MTIHGPRIGPYYEDFHVGDIIKHWPGRTITEADNVWFTLLTMNTHPIHFDSNYAKGQMFGKTLVNSLLTLAIVGGMAVWETSQNAVANLGFGEIKIPKPVFVGDTLYCETEILDKRVSKTNPETGIISARHTGYNQENEVILVIERSFLSKRQGYDRSKIPQFGTQG
jgi:itaconyl-CoA hydratase